MTLPVIFTTLLAVPRADQRTPAECQQAARNIAIGRLVRRTRAPLPADAEIALTPLDGIGEHWQVTVSSNAQPSRRAVKRAAYYESKRADDWRQHKPSGSKPGRRARALARAIKEGQAP